MAADPDTMSRTGPEKQRPATVSGADSPPRPALLRRLSRLGLVEENGIRPLPLAERRNTRFFNIFTVWFSINSNILGSVPGPESAPRAG